jgi:hypothetical protein
VFIEVASKIVYVFFVVVVREHCSCVGFSSCSKQIVRISLTKLADSVEFDVVWFDGTDRFGIRLD